MPNLNGILEIENERSVIPLFGATKKRMTDFKVMRSFIRSYSYTLILVNHQSQLKWKLRVQPGLLLRERSHHFQSWPQGS